MSLSILLHRKTVLAAAACTLIAACGGADDAAAPTTTADAAATMSGATSSSGATSGAAAPTGTGTTAAGSAATIPAPSPAPAAVVPPAPTVREQNTATVAQLPATAANDVRRFLARATFGPSDADVERVLAIGYESWIDEQIARRPQTILGYVDAITAKRRQSDPSFKPGQGLVSNGIWSQMLTDPAQLRARVAFALSEIFVVSLLSGGVHHEPRNAASYYDMLSEKGLGNYRTLLEGVARHSVMARYLSHLNNRKADPVTGRVPDENFAREIMQLFSIGLYQLEADGSRRLVNGKPVETYGPDDVAGMAKVFTGWTWDCPKVPKDLCFGSSSSIHFTDTTTGQKPLIGIAKYHSTEAKSFLGVTIPAQSVADPQASLKVALDTLANHPNVGPFIGRQLIQRLVTSNPSPQYVRDVAAVFADNGRGVRGDLAAVVKAILLHPQAQSAEGAGGKIREPVLRLTAFVRSFPATSVSGEWTLGNPEDAVYGISQTPLRAPSVFNWFRPGFVPVGSQSAARSMVAPEMQITDEASVAGWANYMRWGIQAGAFGTLNSRDIRVGLDAELALAADPDKLVGRINDRLLHGTLPETLRNEMKTGISAIAVPALKADGSNSTQVAAAKRTRVNLALLMAAAAPEFIVQK